MNQKREPAEEAPALVVGKDFGLAFSAVFLLPRAAPRVQPTPTRPMTVRSGQFSLGAPGKKEKGRKKVRRKKEGRRKKGEEKGDSHQN